MSAAMEPARVMRVRAILLAFAAAAIAPSGCSRLQSFRSVGVAPPMLGLRQTPKASPGPDLYADLAKRRSEGRAPTAAQPDAPGPMLVRSTAPPAGAFAVAERTPDGPPAASLGSPSPLDDLPKLPFENDVKVAVTKPGKPDAPNASLAEIRRLTELGRSRLDGVSTYQVRLNRQERVGEALHDPEDVLLSIRRNPRAVRLQWPNGGSKGREVIYAADRDNGQMHVFNPGTLVPRLKMSPDNPLVAKNSRHPITEAGLDAILEQLQGAVAAQEAGGTNETLTLDAAPSKDGGRTVRGITRTIPGRETWVVALDAESGLPTSVKATGPGGELLESYVFSELKLDPTELAATDAFDPDARWGQPQGLLGRIARGAAEKPANSTPR